MKRTSIEVRNAIDEAIRRGEMPVSIVEDIQNRFGATVSKANVSYRAAKLRGHLATKNKARKKEVSDVVVMPKPDKLEMILAQLLDAMGTQNIDSLTVRRDGTVSIKRNETFKL